MEAPLNPEDERAIRAIVAHIEAGWNAGDAPMFAAPFAEDADYVIVDGTRIRSRERIQEGHQQIFDTVYRGSTNRGTVVAIRLLRPDVALAHVEWRLQFRRGDALVDNRAMNSLVMTKDNGEWSIVAFHNTPIAGNRA